jgi:hypothetical protein
LHQIDKNKLILASLGLGALGILIVGFFLSPRPRDEATPQFATPPVTNVAPDVTRVEPFEGTKGLGAVPDVVVTFEAEVDPSKTILKTNPSLEFSTHQKKPNVIVFRPKKPFPPNKKISFRVVVGDIVGFDWTATTKNFNVDDSYAQVVNDVKAQLPHKAEIYLISYDPPLDKYFVYLSAKRYNQAKQEAVSWFSSKGLKNLDPLNITWIESKP